MVRQATYKMEVSPGFFFLILNISSFILFIQTV